MNQIHMDFWQWVGVGVLLGPLILAVFSLLFTVLSDSARRTWRSQTRKYGDDAEPVEEPVEEAQEEVLGYINELKKAPG